MQVGYAALHSDSGALPDHMCSLCLCTCTNHQSSMINDSCACHLQVGYAALRSDSGALPDQLVKLACDISPAVRRAAYNTAADWAGSSKCVRCTRCHAAALITHPAWGYASGSVYARRVNDRPPTEGLLLLGDSSLPVSVIGTICQKCCQCCCWG